MIQNSAGDHPPALFCMKCISGRVYGINKTMLKKIRKKQVLFLIFLFLSTLCGCTAIRERMEAELWKRSGVPEDAAYQEYRTLETNDQLDSFGFYRSEALERQRQAAQEMSSGAVHVSFARNDHLEFTYYRDEAMTEVLSAENCRLDPGDAIYASRPAIINPYDQLYYFDEFQIREYDAAGNLKKVLAESRGAPGLVYRIPEDFSGTEIAVIPLGKYRERTVSLDAVYVHPDGREEVLENGAWEINGKRYGNGTVKLDPMGSYRVVYDYGAYKDRWYFAGSEPEAYWDKAGEGTINFFAVPSNEEHVDYRVRLHPYGTMEIVNGVTFQNAVDSFLDSAAVIFGNKSMIETQNIIDLIQVNGITAINNFSDTEVTVPELKAGDEILIRVPAALKVIAEDLPLQKPETKGDDLEYRFTIPDRENTTFRLSVSRRNETPDAVFREKSAPRGTLAVYDNAGIRYQDGYEAPAAYERIAVEITPESGYCIYGKNVKNNVYRAEMTYAEFTAKYDEILSSHPIKPGIMVTLDTTDELGECTFWTGNEPISGLVMLREGQDLQFDYMLYAESGLEIVLTPDDLKQAVSLWSPTAANRSLDVTEELNGQTLRCRDFFTFKEGAEDVIADPF